MLTMLATLHSNGIVVHSSFNDLINLGLSLAEGVMDPDATLAWIDDHTIHPQTR